MFGSLKVSYFKCHISCSAVVFVLFCLVCLFVVFFVFFCFATGWLCVPCFSVKNKLQNGPRKSSDLKQKLMDKDSPQ